MTAASPRDSHTDPCYYADFQSTEPRSESLNHEFCCHGVATERRSNLSASESLTTDWTGVTSHAKKRRAIVPHAAALTKKVTTAERSTRAM